MVAENVAGAGLANIWNPLRAVFWEDYVNHVPLELLRRLVKFCGGGRRDRAVSLSELGCL